MRNTLVGVGVAVAGIALIAVLYVAGVFGTIGQAHVNAYIAKKSLDSNVSSQIHSASNKIQSQGYFEGLHADYRGYLIKIEVQKGLPSTPYNETNLAGLRQQCIDTTQQYNAAARSISSEEFRSEDLPPSLDPGLCLR